MTRTVIQLVFLLIAAMVAANVLASVPQASTSNIWTEPAKPIFNLPLQSGKTVSCNRASTLATPVHLASGNNDNWGIGYQKSGFYSKGHLVYSQSRPSPSDPKVTQMHTDYMSGRGNPDQILRQNRNENKNRIDVNFSPPKIIQYHSHETAASSQVNDLREQDKKAGHFSNYQVSPYHGTHYSDDWHGL